MRKRFELVPRHLTIFFSETFKVILRCSNDLENYDFGEKQHLAKISLSDIFY